MLFCPKCQQLESTVTQKRNDGTSVFVCKKCGSVIPLRRDLKPGEVVAGFEIESELGRGAMGIVYQARQTNLDREVAIKILSDDSASDEVYVERFFREARAAASLSHPNVVQAYDAGVTSDGIYYFVMEKVTGENLELVLNNVGPLNIPQALDVFLSVANALSYAWTRNQLSHGDIKPENIIMRLNGKVKLADFGLARRAKDPELADEDIRATPAYAPPEIIQGTPDVPGFKSDMYSFGATAYHILIGHEPFVGTDPVKVCAMQVSDIQTPLSELNSNIPQRLSDLVDKLMEKDPEKRPGSWNDVIDELKAIRAELESGSSAATSALQKKADAAAGPVRKTAPRNKSSRTLLLVMAALFAVACVAVLFLLFMPDEDKSVSGGKSPVAGSSGAEKPEGGNAQIRDAAFYRARWNFLQKSFGDSSPDLKAVEDFVGEAGSLAPEEAVSMLLQLQSARNDEETMQTRVLMLRNELLDMANSFRPEEAKKMSFSQIDELLGDVQSKKAELIRLDAALKPSICLPEQIERIESFLRTLADIQVSISLGGDKPSEEKTQASSENGKAQAETDGEKNDQANSGSARIAEYMLLMDNLPKTIESESERASALRIVNELLSDKSVLDKEARQNCIGIRKFLELNQKPLLTYLTNDENALRGMKLFPVSYPDSVLDDITDTTFRLKMTNEKANITQKVAWSRLRREEGEDRIIVTLINSVYLAKLSVDFREYLYARAIFLGIDAERLKKRYERASGLSAQKREELSRIASFFQSLDESFIDFDD